MGMGMPSRINDNHSLNLIISDPDVLAFVQGYWMEPSASNDYFLGKIFVEE